jgi:magnesium-protoporphyrin IX monomethyl ester (oxidative) cyclase
MRVFRITEEISRQVFPDTLDVDHPAFLRNLKRLNGIAEALGRAKAQGGIAGQAKRVGLSAAAAAVFARLYLLRPRRHALPDDARLSPAW